MASSEGDSSTKARIGALARTGRLAEAADACSAYCQDHPSDASAWCDLGVLYGRLEQSEEAAECFRRALALAPDLARAHCGFGAALRMLGRREEAAAALARALELAPDSVEANLELANVLTELRRFEEAEARYRWVLAQRPDVAPAHLGLGDIYLVCNEFEAAIEHYQRVVEREREAPDARTALGRTLAKVGRLDEARAHFLAALERQPDDARAIAGLASTYDQEGEPRRAYEVLRPALREGSEEIPVALAFADICGAVDECAAAAELLRRILRRRDIGVEGERQVRFALGRLHDREGRYEAAFAEFQRANELLPLPYDADKNRRQEESLRSVFTPEFLQAAPRATIATDRPVFIVGMPRSGTSLVEQILSRHPRVHGAGELAYLGRLAAGAPLLMGAAEDYPACLRGVTVEALNQLGAQYLGQLARIDPAADRVTDKLPHNFLRLGLVELILPQARVIHCARDPLDTCLSIYFQNFTMSHTYSGRLDLIGREYLRYRRLMAHWRRVLRIPILDVHYDTLVDDLEAESRRIVEYCGLEWDERCLEFHSARRFVGTVSYAQVRRPVYRSSVGRWRHYERHLEELKSVLNEELWHRGGVREL